MNKHMILTIIVGFLNGFILAYLLWKNNWDYYFDRRTHKSNLINNGIMLNPTYHNKHEEFHKHKNTSVADELKDKIRILCWVMTAPDNHEKYAKHVKATWGKRCNTLLFMSSKNDTSLPTIALPVKEGREYLWAKTKEAFKYIYQHYFDQADWFMKADDDTYVIVENLRYMLKAYNSSTPIYFGSKYKPCVTQGYMSGGAGYVLSKEAVRRFVQEGMRNKKICSANQYGSEDVEIGRCLAEVKVQAGDSRDSMGRGRFFPFAPEHQLSSNYKDFPNWYYQYIFYKIKLGMECCSDNAVSFHYMTPNQMYELEYFLYHLRPYGITYHDDFLLNVNNKMSTQKYYT